MIRTLKLFNIMCKHQLTSPQHTILHNRLSVSFAAAYSADRRIIVHDPRDAANDQGRFNGLPVTDMIVSTDCTKRLSPFTHLLTTLWGSSLVIVRILDVLLFVHVLPELILTDGPLPL